MKELNFKILYSYLSSIYKKHNSKEINNLCNEIKRIFFKTSKKKNNELWSEKDCFLITYADSVKNKKKK